MASSSELSRSRGLFSSLGVDGDADSASDKRPERAECGNFALGSDEADGVAESGLIRLICTGGVRAFKTSRCAWAIDGAIRAWLFQTVRVRLRKTF